MAEFVGREKWIKQFRDYLSQKEGVLWKLTGQPGIGKSSLLSQFNKICQDEERPNTWLDMESCAPAHGLDVLAALAESAAFFDTENSNKSLKEKAGEGFKTFTDGVVGALDLGKDLIPGGALLAGGAKVLVSLGSGIAGKAALISETQAAAQPELYLLDALSAAASNNNDSTKAPVCIVDTYEHILDKQLKIKTRLLFSNGNVRNIQEKEVQLSQWLSDLLTYLSEQGWCVVVAGRAIPRSNANDKLQPFTRKEISAAAKSRPALRDYLDTQEKAVIQILATLSFEGNPLWLQVAMNLLENLLAEGRDLELLADNPKELQNCFEEEDPLEIDDFDGVEHSSCKLSLIGTMTKHIEGLEDQAWKIAIPRILDKGIVQQLFNREQANAILHNFNLAGVFRKSGQQFTLHEEIRDLLLFYARHKGWWDSDETRQIHGKLWDYLNDFYLGKLPDDLRSVMTREGLTKVYREKSKAKLTQQLTEHFDLRWMLEAYYHRVMSQKVLADKNILPIDFWAALGGSASFSPIDKWRIAEALPTLSEIQIRELVAICSEELNNWRKLFGEETGKALYQEQLAGNTEVLKDLSFWEQRVNKFGLAGDYYFYISVIREFYSDLYPKKGLELTDKLLELYGDSGTPLVQEQCAKALYDKGGTLSNKLNEPQAAIASYDELLEHFADSENPAVQELCAKALVNKGVTLGEKLNDPQAAIASYDELLERFANSENPAVQELCAKALVNKGVTLGEKLNDPQAAIASYDKLLERFANSENPAVQELCLYATANSIKPLLVLGKSDKTIPLIHQVLEHVGSDDKKSAIMTFLLWLADPETTIDSVLQSIKNLPSDIKFAWSCKEIRPFIDKLDTQRKAQAEAFIAYFGQHQNLEQLESDLK